MKMTLDRQRLILHFQKIWHQGCAFNKAMKNQRKKKTMIATAVQRGSSVYVYSEKGSLMFSLSGMLHGYTGTTVSVKRGSTVYVYNGRQSLINSFSSS